MDAPPDDSLPTRPAGPWVRDKLGILEAYFPRFVGACRGNAPRWFYVDGLAGSGVNTIADEGYARVWGSAMIAAQTNPRFSRCVFLEQRRSNANALRQRAERVAPGRSITKHGDVNAELLPLMQNEVERKAPILCLLDPEGIEVNWRTIEDLARFRTSKRVSRPNC